MKLSWNILAAALALITLLPTAFGHPDLICVESSGRISYGCNDVVPDDALPGIVLSTRFGLSSQNCGLCHDYVIGQATTQLSQAFTIPTPDLGLHQEIVRLHFSRLLNDLQSVPLDTSGSSSPLKC